MGAKSNTPPIPRVAVCIQGRMPATIEKPLSSCKEKDGSLKL